MVTRVPEFKEEHEGACLRCTEGKLTMGPFPSCNNKTLDVEQPKGFEIHNRESHVCRLKKYLSSLKQAPQSWYEKIYSYQMKLRFTRSEANPNHCFKVVDDRPLILVPYEDELFLTGTDPLIGKSKRELDSKFGMVDCKPVTTPMELKFKKLCGSPAAPNLENASEFHKLIIALMFLVKSHPDICFAVSMLSQHMAEPHHSHWIGAKNLLRYLQGTITHGLRYTAGVVRLHCYSDTD